MEIIQCWVSKTKIWTSFLELSLRGGKNTKNQSEAKNAPDENEESKFVIASAFPRWIVS